MIETATTHLCGRQPQVTRAQILPESRRRALLEIKQLRERILRGEGTPDVQRRYREVETTLATLERIAAQEDQRLAEVTDGR